MSEYRSELHAANERIVALEAELARLGPAQRVGKPFSIRRLAGVLFLALLAAPLVVFGAASCRHDLRAVPPDEYSTPPAPPPDPPRLRSGLGWLDDGARVGASGPRFIDIDGDEKAEIVGLAWDRAVADGNDGLHAVALDADTLRAKWTSAAFAGHLSRDGLTVEHLVVVPGAVLVTDARGLAHVLDLRTGKERRSHALGFVADAACAAPDGTPRFLIAREGIPWAPPPGPLVGFMAHEIARIKNVVVDPQSGAVTPASIHTFCSWSDYCGESGSDGCRELSEREDAPPTPTLDIHAHEIWRDGDARVSLGAPAVDEVPGATRIRDAVAGWSAKTRAVAWETPLGWHRTGMERPIQMSWHAFHDGTFVAIETTPEGPVRLRALDFATGAIRFDRALDRSGIGTEVTSVAVHGDGIYVGRGARLERYDAHSGSLTANGESP